MLFVHPKKKKLYSQFSSLLLQSPTCSRELLLLLLSSRSPKIMHVVLTQVEQYWYICNYVLRIQIEEDMHFFEVLLIQTRI